MKKILSLIVLFSTPIFSAHAQINTQALEACSLIENDFNRLLCYDNIIAGKAASQNTSSVPSIAAKEMVQASAPIVTDNTKSDVKKDDFGLEHKEITKGKATEIKATVTSIKKAPYGELIITLDNGQQWRQIGSDSMKLTAEDKIIISRGVFNSFLLKKANQNRSIRVKRTN
ncbi:hypothetical protein J8L70_14645 [Pseudoalteromonas sp. MMG010]|uniref:hypothetical protein n=1 Tax=Pseudoalteromonas sp. MMG010 TaxID=2822685 RepID=UPI001B39D8CF|nr:hypothetical protein [Pseudoalteromonas sp. MMG010]MBQ4834485.1 hypothetical protein [Pseudoalteromonas sp. MMG010]